MARWMGLDYGVRKTGIAVTDPLRIICSGLDTVPTHQLLDYLADYFSKEEVALIVIGEPLHPDGKPLEPQHQQIVGLSRKLRKLYPDKQVELQDERFSTLEAREILLRSGAKRKKRQEKGVLDKISAALILENYISENT